MEQDFCPSSVRRDAARHLAQLQRCQGLGEDAARRAFSAALALRAAGELADGMWRDVGGQQFYVPRRFADRDGYGRWRVAWTDADRKKKSKVFNVCSPARADVRSALESAKAFRQELALQGLVELGREAEDRDTGGNFHYVKCDLRTGLRYVKCGAESARTMRAALHLGRKPWGKPLMCGARLARSPAGRRRHARAFRVHSD